MSISPCWFWEHGVAPAVLDVLEKEVRELDLVPSTLAFGNADSTVRHSNSNAFPPYHWFTGVLYNFALHANREAGWQRALEFPEVTQVAEYKVGQYYKWHIDTNPFVIEPYERKITAICLLSDPAEFEGGVLELEFAVAPKLKRGSVIAFPSNLRHQVTPVTKGVRVSATCWAIGPQKW